jgi:hypothetical protein
MDGGELYFNTYLNLVTPNSLPLYHLDRLALVLSYCKRSSEK